jgi:AraC-like DNA-binding protein
MDAEDAFETSERALRVLARTLEHTAPERTGSGRPATEHVRARIVDDARELVAAEPTIGLVEMARRVAVSPHHLSRIFHRLTGETLSRYRNRMRVRLALERMAEGEGNISAVASDLGFADAAHMARTVRAENGDPPSSLRDILRRSPNRR